MNDELEVNLAGNGSGLFCLLSQHLHGETGKSQTTSVIGFCLFVCFFIEILKPVSSGLTRLQRYR
jgi:hypothetical protein